jgi:transposase
MIPVSGGVRVYIATRPVDFRKGHDGLAAVVQDTLKLDPFCGAIFVFRSKRADRLKLIVWDGTGLVLAHKRLESSKFAWPKVADGVMKLTPAQFSALVEGLDWRAVRSARHPRPTSAG